MTFVLVFANIFCCSTLSAKMQKNKRQRAGGKNTVDEEEAGLVLWVYEKYGLLWPFRINFKT